MVRKVILQESVQTVISLREMAKVNVEVIKEKTAWIQEGKTILGGNFQIDAPEMIFPIKKKKKEISFAKDVEVGNRDQLRVTQIDNDITDN